MKFNQTTPTTLTLQARDIVQMAFIAKGSEFFENFIYDLKQLFQAATPPAGVTNVNIPAQPLNVFLLAFYEMNNRHGKQIFKAATNRIRTAIEALATAETIQFFADFDAEQNATENAYQEIGRKYLRGKLN